MLTLMELQMRVASAVMSPLTQADEIASRTVDGQPMRALATELIKPNDRLTSLERLGIYNRQYWFRVLDSLYEDFPGLCAILGPGGFHRLCRAYLTDCPSQSFTLRNLGARLDSWLRDHPEFGSKNLRLARDMIHLEWAHIEAFDNSALSPIGPDDLRDLGPHLRLTLQPYISLLELRYPVDDLRIRVNAASEQHGAASNAMTQDSNRVARPRFNRVQPERIFLAVHRLGFSVYYRRLEPQEFHVLEALRRGDPIGEAIKSSFETNTTKWQDLQAIKWMIEGWFATWAEMGWLCKYHESEPKKGRDNDLNNKAA
jgi:hypothetical protein